MKFGPLPELDFEKDPFPTLPISELHSAVVPLVVVSSEELIIEGTAFSIGPPGLFVTAEHAVRHAQRLCEEQYGPYVGVVYLISATNEETGESFLTSKIVPIEMQAMHPKMDIAAVSAPGTTETNSFLHRSCHWTARCPQ